MNNHAENFERILLAITLAESEKTMPECLKMGVTPDDYYDLQYRKIYAAMLRMHSAKKPIVTTTVSEETGIELPVLDKIMEGAMPHTYAEYYVKQIKEAAAKRKLEQLPAVIAENIKAGKTAGELRAQLLSEIAQITTDSPESEQAQIKARFFTILQIRSLTRAEQFKQMADVVLEYLHKRGRFFFHEEHKNFETAMYFDGVRKLLLQIDDDEFQAWLSHFIGINRIETAYKSIYSALRDEALNGRTTGLHPEAYWAARPGVIYLSNGDGQVAKITAGKVELVDNGTDDVLFAAGRTLKPWKLTTPADPFDRCRVFSDMKATAKHGRELLRLWAIALPSNQRCKPPLVLAGAVGSGKTRTALGIAELFGLPARVLVPTEKGEDDLWTSLDTGGMVVIDNADTRLRWLPDALAAASTDGSHEKRRLYSDGQIVQQRARAWIIVTSANPTFGADAGLADRLLVERFERREIDNAESELSDEIAANRDAGMSWIADTLSKALTDNLPVPSNLNKRHPDFATLAVRIGRAIGRETEAVAALGAAEADKSIFNLENDEIGAALMLLLERNGSFIGTASELAAQLPDLNIDYWTPRRVGKRIAKLWPHILGVFRAMSEHGHGGNLIYSIRRRGGYGGFQDPISPKVPMRENENTLREMTPGNPPNPPIDPVEANER